MRVFISRLGSLVFGLFLFAVGIVMTMTANIGYAPWDVLHRGLSDLTGISFGTVSILIGLIILIAVAIMGKKIGLGSILNMILIGAFIDLLFNINIIPEMNGLISGVLFFLAGLFVIAFASYFYIKAGFGAGPRDYLMIVIRERTHWAVGISRALVEGSVVLIGWLLGGPVGGGTVLAAVGISVCVQLVFALLRFDPAKVQHETLVETLQSIKNLK